LNEKINLEKYARCIKNGEVLLFPTDTVVGIGCRFDSEEGISRMRSIKQVKETAPFAVLISSPEQLEQMKIRRSRISNLLISRFWPGGLTIVMTSENHYPCCGEDNAIGVRMPDFDLLRKLIEIADVPLAATSANYHSKPAPKRIADVEASMVKKIDCVLDFPARLVGQPSTVVRLEAGEPTILREGAIPSKEIFETVRETV